MISPAAAESASSSMSRVADCSGSDEALGEQPGLLPAGFGGDQELVAEVVDVAREVHDVTMTSL